MTIVVEKGYAQTSRIAEDTECIILNTSTVKDFSRIVKTAKPFANERFGTGGHYFMSVSLKDAAFKGPASGSPLTKVLWNVFGIWLDVRRHKGT
jgi:hypothetical protein